MKRAIAISLIDQGFLSAQSLLMTLILVRFGDGAAVGRFALVAAVYFAMLTVQDSLFGSVLATRVYGRAAGEQRRMIGMIATVAVACLFPVAVLVTLGVAFWLDLSLNVTLSAAAMVLAGLFRELNRSVSVASDDMHRCLRIDAGSAVMALLLLPVFWRFNPAEAACLWSIAAGHLLATLAFKPGLHLDPAGAPAAIGHYARHFNFMGWSLTTSMAHEVKSRTFLFIVEALRGLSATASIHAGRMVISPVVLFAMAIGRIALPRMANHVSRGERGAAMSIARQVALVLALISLTYALAIYAAWPLFERYLFQGGYPQIERVMLAWCAYSVLTVPIWCLYWLYRALDRYREIATVAAIEMVIVLGAMLLLMLPVPLYSSIVILTVTDVCTAVILIWRLSAPSMQVERLA